MRILTFVLLLVSFTSFAQQSKVFRIDSLPAQGILLDKGWKWHAGDNPEFAKADFDDSKWESIDPTKEVVQLPQISTGRPLWLRLKISHKAAKAYALSISQSGATELYLNGQLIQKIGKIAPNKQHGSAAYNPLDNRMIMTLDSLDNVLAIRYYFQQGLNYDPIFNIRYHLFSARIFDSSDLLVSRNNNFWPGFNIGVYLILFIVHGILFLYYPPLKANFWYSGWAFLSTLFVYFLFLLEINPYLERNAQYVLFSLILSQVSLFCLLYCVYLLLELKRKVYLFLIPGIALIHIAGYYFFSYEVRDPVWFVATLVQTLLSVLMALDANRTGDRRGMPLMYGVLSYLGFWTLFTLSYPLSWSQMAKDLLFHLASLSLPITVSALLGLKFRQVNLAMLRNLEQVNQLFTEKQHILATQNETLEQQVEERTAELKASQAQLIQSEKLASLGELTAGIAHEIQNPLNFVNNFAEVSAEMLVEMKEELKSGRTPEAIHIADDLEVNLQKINHHGQRASNIVKGMLEHSRASSGTKQPTDLNALADEYLRLAYYGLRAKDSSFNATMETHFDASLPKIEIIPQDIGRVLLNLINNAFYAVNEKAKQDIEGYEPTVTVSSAVIGDKVEIRVKDNGNGIPEAIRDKIFQPFFTTKPTGQGTGLGLSLAHDIVVKGHGGTIEVHSTADQGTDFIIQLKTIFKQPQHVVLLR